MHMLYHFCHFTNTATYHELAPRIKPLFSPSCRCQNCVKRIPIEKITSTAFNALNYASLNKPLVLYGIGWQNPTRLPKYKIIKSFLTSCDLKMARKNISRLSTCSFFKKVFLLSSTVSMPTGKTT